MTDLFGFSPEEADLFQSARSNALRPHPTASIKANGAKVWNELVQLTALRSERVERMNNAQPGDVCGFVEYELTVSLDSEDFNGNASPNVGRKIKRRSYFNFSAFRRAPDSNEGHSAMTTRSIRLFYSLAVALDLDKEGAANPEKWIAAHQDAVGAKVIAVIRQAEGRDGDLEDEIQRFVAPK